MREKTPAVYLLTNKRNGTLYTGATSDLVARVWQHKHNQIDGFTKKYGVHTLVYFERHDDMIAAFQREKHIKKWHRKRKLDLVEQSNPEWRDLCDDII